MAAPMSDHVTVTDITNTLGKDILVSHEGGITIDGVSFNVFVYADDILLASTTASGLQNLIDSAVSYVLQHGLHFKPSNTHCTIIGKTPFLIEPDWKIDKCTLSITENIEYLGAFVGNRCSKLYVAKRVSCCRKAFYALQGAGLCQQGLETDTAMHVWSATCKTILLYGCDSLSLSKGNKEELEKIQARLLKCIIGIGPRHKTSPLLKALNMFNISEHIDINCLLLLNKIMGSHSAARTFILIMLRKNCVCPHLLINRVHQTCIRKNINFIKVICSDTYCKQTKTNLLCQTKTGVNGTVNSLHITYFFK